MQGTISGVRYGRAWGLRLGLLLGFTFAFPFLVYALVHNSGASAIPGAAGALAVILGVYLKPLAYPLFAASIATISIARAKSAGMPGKIGAYIALLVLADLPFGIVFGSHWGVALASGLYGVQPPFSFVAALIAGVTLCLVRDPTGPMTGRYSVAYRLWSWLLIFMMAIGLIEFLLHFWHSFFGLPGLSVGRWLQRGVSYLQFFTFYPSLPMALLIAASTGVVRSSREQSDGPLDMERPNSQA